MSGDNKAVMRRVYEEIFNQGNIALADELITPDCIDHAVDAPMPVPNGPGPIKGFVSWFRTAFPDAHWTIDDLVADGNEVAGIVTLRGTHTGEYRGVPPTGKEVNITGVVIFRVDEGRVVERWGGFDALGLLEQIGIGAQMGQAMRQRPPSPAGPPPGAAATLRSEQKGERPVSEDEMRTIVHRVYEDVFTEGNEAVLDEVVAADAVDHAKPIAQRRADIVPRGPTPYKHFANRFRAGFPDMKWTVDDIMIDGDKVMASWTMRGTHTGPFMFIAPTNKDVTVTGMVVFRIADGKIVERWAESDNLGLLQQLGVVPIGGGPQGGPPGG